MNTLPNKITKMSTRNLLAFFKAERKRFWMNGFICSCGCGEFKWDIYDGYESLKEKYTEKMQYLNSLKQELNQREHVNKNNSNDSKTKDNCRRQRWTQRSHS